MENEGVLRSARYKPGDQVRITDGTIRWTVERVHTHPVFGIVYDVRSLRGSIIQKVPERSLRLYVELK